ncbi:MAG: MFS transporter [Alphaproteobacteria bacterium]|nr:MFS transporter [Alphaproteobacteria bacterium]
MTIDFIGKSVLLFVASLTVLAGAIIAPSLPHIVDHLIADGVAPEKANFWGKMLLSIPALMILLCSPLMGYLVDRFGRRKVLLTGLFLFSLSGVWGGIYPHLTPLIISRIGLGIAVSMSMTTAVTLVSDYFKGHEREQFMGYFSSAMGVGGMTYFILGGFVATLHWRFPFFIYLLALPAFILAYYHLPEPEQAKQVKTTVQEAIHGNHTPPVPFIMIGILYGTAFLNMAIYYIIPTQLPFVLKEIGYVSSLHVGLTTSACSLAGASIAFLYGRIKGVFTHSHMFMVAFMLIGVGYGTLFMFQTYVSIIVGLFIAGMGFGIVMPNTGTWLMRIAPEHVRGRVAGGLSSSINMGQFLSPIISLGVLAYFPVIYVFPFFAIICLIISLLYGGFYMNGWGR